MGKKKEAEQPAEPEPVKVPSRGVLLNKWASRQDKLQRLVGQVATIKEELVGIAQLLHAHYGVMVQDTTHTVTLPKAAPAPAAPEGETPGEDGEPKELLKPEDNPLAKSPVPVIGTPATQPLSEQQVAEIREEAALEKGANPEEFQSDIASKFDRAVRVGLGKTPPGKVGPK